MIWQRGLAHQDDVRGFSQVYGGNVNHRQSDVQNFVNDGISPYSDYKDSGIEWLGRIPAHWEVKRLKHLLAEPLKYGANEPAEHTEYNLPRYIRITDIREDGTLRDDSFRSLPENIAKPYLLVAGDILFARSGATVGKTFRYHPSWGKAAYAGYLIRARLDNIQALSNFVEYFTQSQGYTDWLQSTFIQATIQNVSAERYASLRISVPSLPEQRAIANFLDRETARIDALVAKKERLIELLNEKRSALISHAVTNGLDPDVSMKDSGVEWLGEIPAHWEVRRLRTLANIATGGRDTVDQRENGQYPFFVRSQTVERINTWSFDGEAILTAGDGVGVAKVFHYVNGKFDFHQRVYRFSNFRFVTGRFFFYYFMAMLRFEVLQGTAKSTVDSLRLPMLQNFPVVVFAPTEQISIVAYLDREAARIDSLAKKVRVGIDRLTELRQALISAAVRGKIDVRDALAPPPEDASSVSSSPSD